MSTEKNNYHSMREDIQKQIMEDRTAHKVNPYAFKDENVVRKYAGHDKANLWRPAFVRDIEKIMHNPYYGRYSDKTQVFSLYKNDDITRRSQHVQMVSRIARNIGSLLGLNLDLIEAISLGHDIGHTPFGHAGERKLSEIYHRNTGRYFNHNIQSARVFTTIFPVNVSLQTLDGIICHNGELELKEYRPKAYFDFDELERRIEAAYVDKSTIEKLVPATLEGCVMRVSDIIAYLGKDRQDAQKLGILEDASELGNEIIGKSNAEIINNIIVNIVENSYGKDYIAMDDAFFEALKKGKKDNYKYIYQKDGMENIFEEQIYPMFEDMYEKLLLDIKSKRADSDIMIDHVEYINTLAKYYPDRGNYLLETPDAIVCDYLASMTDDYFIDLYHRMFPNGKYKVTYKDYFERRK